MSPRTRSIRQRTSGDGAEAPVAQRNALLARVPDHELDALLARAKQRHAGSREVFFEVGDPIEKIYFPITGLCSVLTELNNGSMLEAMTIGREGFLGLTLFHGVRTQRARCLCQVEGEFFEVPADDFEAAVSDSSELNAVLHLYAQFAQEVLMQSAACNSTHLVEQRCARWLLTTADGVQNRTFNLTQEFMSQMLAVRRAGVTVAIGALERQGLIAHEYGSVTIVDEPGLTKASCECYVTIRNRYRDLFSNGENA